MALFDGIDLAADLVLVEDNVLVVDIALVEMADQVGNIDLVVVERDVSVENSALVEDTALVEGIVQVEDIVQFEGIVQDYFFLVAGLVLEVNSVEIEKGLDWFGADWDLVLLDLLQRESLVWLLQKLLGMNQEDPCWIVDVKR